MRSVPISLALPIAITLVPGTLAAQQPSKEMAQAVSAYAAKITASAIFVSGRTLESVLAQELAPTRPLEILIQPLLRFAVDLEQQTVTCRLGVAKATAQFYPTLGCTLVVSDQAPSKQRRQFRVTRDEMRKQPESLDAGRNGIEEALFWPTNERRNDASATGINKQLLSKAIDSAFAEPNPTKPVHTRAIVVVHKGQLVMERYADGFHRDMPLPGWSMSKTLTNALVGMRVKAGKFDLDQPARDRQPPKGMQAPTIRNLLSMTPGLQWNEDYDDPNSNALRMLFGSADHGAVYAELPQVFSAGSQFQYASGATNLICKLLRQTFADDADYWRLPSHLFDQLGMATAVLETDPSGTFVGSSYCYASARDWARLGLLYQQDGVFFGKRLLPAGWVQQSTACIAASQGRFGYHIWLNRDPDGEGPEQRQWNDLPEDLFRMDGHEGQYCVISPSAELVIVRLGCTKSGGFPLHGFVREVHAAAAQ